MDTNKALADKVNLNGLSRISVHFNHMMILSQLQSKERLVRKVVERILPSESGDFQGLSYSGKKLSKVKGRREDMEEPSPYNDSIIHYD